MKSVIQQYYHDTPVDTERMLVRVRRTAGKAVVPAQRWILLVNGMVGILLLLFFLQYSIVFSMGFFAPFLQAYSLFGSLFGFAFHSIMALVSFLFENYQVLMGISFLGFVSQVGMVTVSHRGIHK